MISLSPSVSFMLLLFDECVWGSFVKVRWSLRPKLVCCTVHCGMSLLFQDQLIPQLLVHGDNSRPEAGHSLIVYSLYLYLEPLSPPCLVGCLTKSRQVPRPISPPKPAMPAPGLGIMPPSGPPASCRPPAPRPCHPPWRRPWRRRRHLGNAKGERGAWRAKLRWVVSVGLDMFSLVLVCLGCSGLQAGCLFWLLVSQLAGWREL